MRTGDNLEGTLRDSPLKDYLGAKRFDTFKMLSILEIPNGSILLYYNNRVFILTQVRKEMLEVLHQFHFAPAGMIATAKAYIYWPGWKEDIIERYKQNTIWTTEQKARTLSTPVEPKLTHRRPMGSLCTDWCKLGLRKFLMWSDRHTGYLWAREF